MSAIGKADLPGKGSVARSTEYDPGAYELLKTIDGPAALRALDRRGLQRLAEELRTFILESVSQTGGHLSSNLGTVELTISCTTSSTRRTTASSGTWDTRPIRTRFSP